MHHPLISNQLAEADPFERRRCATRVKRVREARVELVEVRWCTKKSIIHLSLCDMNLTLFNSIFNLTGRSRLLDLIGIFSADYSGYVLLAILAVIYWRGRHVYERRMVLIALCSASASRVVAEMIRYFYHHPRPFAILPIHPLVQGEQSYSFPSGHASFFFGLSTVVSLYHPRLGLLFMITSLLMGIARVFVGVHWPADILAGLALGLMIGLVTNILFKKFHIFAWFYLKKYEVA